MKELIEKLITSSGSTYVGFDELKRRYINKEELIEACKNHELNYRVKDFKGYKSFYYTLPYLRDCEKTIAKKVVERVNTPNKQKNLSEEELDALIKEYEETSGKQLADQQAQAVKMAANSHMAIVTGGPGTGKTTTLNALRYVEAHRGDKKPFEVFLAPTGKAARRMTEAVGVEAHTIQSEIGANEYEDNPYIIDADIVYVDEISMLDTVVMYQLIRCLTPSTRLIMLGDVDQLPSVGAGAVLKDLIESTVVPTTMLDKTFRQAEGSVLMENIKYIRNTPADRVAQQADSCFIGMTEGDDFVSVLNYDEENIVEELKNTYIQALNEYGEDNVILLTPYRKKGATCANEMNKVLQRELNHSKISVEATIVDTDEDGEEYELDVLFKLGDPVMQLVNRFDEPVANGDVGRIVAIYTDNAIDVEYPHYTKTYEVDELKELNLCYAMSVHKSQGSEYKCVITCALPEHERLLNRNMVYTAITRAKQKCIFYCSKQTLKIAMSKEAAYERTTFLEKELRDAAGIDDVCDRGYDGEDIPA